MCNISARLQAVIPFIQGRSLYELYPNHFMQNWPYDRVQPYHCIGCGRRMSHEELWPANRATPRAMCPECYSQWTSAFTERCPVCGDYLEKWRIDNQKCSPNEVTFRLHDGRCLDYFSLLSGKALGQDMSFLRDEYYVHPQQLPRQMIRHEHQKYIDAQYVDIRHQPRQILRVPAPRQRALPLPQEQLRVPNQFKGSVESVPVRRTYKGKRVKYIHGD